MTVFLKSKFSQDCRAISHRPVDVHEKTDSYLNHPTLGLLYSVCVLEEKQELFTTIYAKRLFFLVTTTSTGIKFEPIGRTNARLMVENCLSQLRRLGQSQEYNKLQTLYQQTF